MDNEGNVSQLNTLLFSLLSSLSESEMMVKLERMKRGIQYNLAMENQEEVFLQTNKEKYYVIEQEEANILKRIFNDYIKTEKSLREITRDLKEEGYFPKTSETTLYTELQKWTKDKRSIGNKTFPQIISEEELKLCQESRARHFSLHSSKNREKWLLKGLIYDIGIGMMTGTFCVHNKTRIYQYTSHNKEKNKSHSVSQKRIDPIVWDEVKKLYKKYISNKNKIIKELKVKLELTSLKINNIKNDIDNIQNRIDNIEERLIFGRISQSRCDELSIKLIMEKDEKERRNTELMNDYLFYQYQIQEIELSKEIDLEKMTISDKIDIINKVIDIISFKRIDSHKSIINIYNKFNKRVIVYQINTYGKTLGIKLEDRLEKPNERPKKNFRPKKMWSYNYKGELIKGVKTL